ncbi:MAG: sugar ABC transporter ATP-binding protein [Acidobacteriota bacterium]
MILRLRGLRKRFGATVALDGVDLDVGPGQVHALIGENGAGKSTLLNILSGNLRADSGELSLEGAPYAPRDPGAARQRGVAHVHQELMLCPHLSVAENIFLGIEPASHGRLRKDVLFERAAALLGEFGRSEIDPRRRTAGLSLADRQVVEICRALASEARVLLLDEPTSSLQRGDVERLFRVITQLRDRGMAIVYISHFLEEVREIASRYTVLRDGRSVASGELRGVSDEQLIEQMVGRSVDRVVDRERRIAPDVVLAVRDFAAPPRLKHASFELRRGEILGIAGLIGSGRTELIRALYGLIPSSGNVVLTANGAGYLSEDRKGEGLALQMSVADNLTLTRFESCAKGGWIDRARQLLQSEAIMQRLRIKAPSPRTAVHRLSGGNQQKVALGRLLHQDAGVLLLDEPARGIDVASKSEVYRQIGALAAEGKAILVVSSYLPELFAICDRLAVMTRGTLSAARPIVEWTPVSVMEAAIGAERGA